MQIYRRFLWSLYYICFLLTLTACGARIQEVRPDSTTSYQHFSEINGLRASADMFNDEARLNTYFGDNLLKKGVLPVYIVFENNRAKGGYVLLKEQSKFTTKVNSSIGSQDTSSTNVIGNNPADERSRSDAVATLAAAVPAALGEGATVFAGAPLVLGPAGFVVGTVIGVAISSYQANKERVFHNIEEKQMIEKAVYPGERHSGFIYFNIKEADVKNIEGIILTAKNLKNQELEQLFISLK